MKCRQKQQQQRNEEGGRWESKKEGVHTGRVGVQFKRVFWWTVSGTPSISSCS